MTATTRRKNLKRTVTAAVVVTLLAALGLGVRHFRASTLPGTVPTAAARLGEFLVTVTVRGSVNARRSVELDAPNVNGLTITWLAPTGSRIEAGKPIAKFDSSTAHQQFDAKTAALAQAQAALDQAQATASITDQQDALDLATASNAVKSAQLDASKAAIVSAIDGAESQLVLGMAAEKLKVEQANINAHLTSNQAKIASAQRLRDKAQADLDLVQRQLEEMELDTPIAGVVNYLTNYSQGWVNAQPFKVGDNVWATATIAEIPDLASLEVIAKVSEVDRGRVVVGDDLRAHFDALPELTLTGKIVGVSALAEPDFSGSWPPPEVFRLTANMDGLDPRLRPDMNGNMEIVTQRLPNAISVPAAAIFPIAGNPVVYIERDGAFQPVRIQILARNPEEAAVSGVPAGAKVALTDPTLAAKSPVGAP